MHLPDGYLPLAVAGAGFLLTGATTAIIVKKSSKELEPREIVPKVALSTAVYFAATLVSIPLPPTSVHLSLGGFMGILLGPWSFVAILIALSFQAVLLGFGGITTIGINAIVMGIPALLCGYIFSKLKDKIKESRVKQIWIGGFSGSFSLLLSLSMFMALSISFMPAELNRSAELVALSAMFISHIPVLIIEGIFTAMILVYLSKTNPSMIYGDNGDEDNGK